MAFTGELSDRIAIRELLETYNDAVNQRDAAAWEATWHPEASWNIMGMEISGRDAIVTTWKGAMGGFSYVLFTAFPGAIEIESDEAKCRVYVRETLITTDGQKRNLEGLYIDKVKKTDGKWAFTHRDYKIINETNNQEG